MAYRSSTTNTGNSTTPSVAVPAGVQTNDIVIIGVSSDAAPATFSTGIYPSGFTMFEDLNVTADGQSMSYGWKRLTGADSGTYTFGSDGSTSDWACAAIAFSGRDTANNPVNSSAAINSVTNASPVTATANGVTAVIYDDLLWIVTPDVTISNAYTSTTAPSGYTKIIDFKDTTFSSIAMAYKEAVGAGATGSVAGTFTMSSGNSGWAAMLVRIPSVTKLYTRINNYQFIQAGDGMSVSEKIR